MLQDTDRKMPEKATQRQNTVLLVDDDRDWCALCKASLESRGISCLTAFTIDEANYALRSNRISLILLDWRLKEPNRERSGAEFLSAVRQKDLLLPVIVISGLPFELCDVRSDAIMSEADGFFQKPFSPFMLAAHIERWFKRMKQLPISLFPESIDQVLPLEQVKRNYIKHVFGLLGRNVSLAAKKLQIHRHTVSTTTKGDDETPSIVRELKVPPD